MLSNHKLTCVSPPCFFAFVFSLNPVRWSPLFSKSAALGLILAKHFCLKAIPILMADRIVENWGYRVVTPGEKRMIEYARELDLTPELFEEDLKELFKAASSDDHSRLEKVLDRLFKELSKIAI